MGIKPEGVEGDEMRVTPSVSAKRALNRQSLTKILRSLV